MDPKETIIDIIKESTDEGMIGTFYLSDAYLKTIYFSDVMDIVLYYISLQPDADDITRMDTSDFMDLLQIVWRRWCSVDKKDELRGLKSAWLSGPGPGGGTASSGEMYFSYYPAINRFDTLRQFFSHPYVGWVLYMKRLKSKVFPKWRREYNLKKLDKVFELAEMVCKEMRP